VTTLRDVPKSYGDAARFLNAKDHGKGNVQRAIVANNTVIERTRLGRDGGEFDAFHLLLHGHCVLTWYHDGRIVLDSCGYRTVTTKDRLNRAQSIVRVSSKDHRWYVTNLSTWEVEPFFDGITYVDHGQAIGAFYDTHGGVGQPACGD